MRIVGISAGEGSLNVRMRPRPVVTAPSPSTALMVSAMVVEPVQAQRRSAKTRMTTSHRLAVPAVYRRGR
jgi:hypothetical protein